MNNPRRRMFAPVFGAVLAVLAMADGRAPVEGARGGLLYRTDCAAAAPNTVDGFVTNGSQDAFQAAGEARFVFSTADSMSRPAVLVQVDSLIPPGATVRVARAYLAIILGPNEKCRFEVRGVIRKI